MTRIMRSIYMKTSDDVRLRQLARELNVSKGDLIRAAINVKLSDWLNSNSENILKDLAKSKEQFDVA